MKTKENDMKNLKGFILAMPLLTALAAKSDLTPIDL